MSEVEDQPEPGPVLWDAPNQQVVREDESAPWDEGTGGEPGSEGAPAEAEQQPAETSQNPLDQMSKAQLLEHAKAIGVYPANNDMTKEELRAGIDAYEAGS